MPIDWSHDPEESDLPAVWAVPLNESVDPAPTILPLPSRTDSPSDTDSFLLQGSDPAPGDEFHPRLRRFGEAA
jgi:hypothetical protein